MSGFTVTLDSRSNEMFSEFMDNFKLYANMADQSMDRYFNNEIPYGNEVRLAQGLNKLILALSRSDKRIADLLEESGVDLP